MAVLATPPLVVWAPGGQRVAWWWSGRA